VVRRILEEMARQHIGVPTLCARLGSGWTMEYLAMRLGELLPITATRPRFGGRVPLTATEILEMADALRVPVAELLGAHELALAVAS
jgi:hypothetical protein